MTRRTSWFALSLLLTGFSAGSAAVAKAAAQATEGRETPLGGRTTQVTVIVTPDSGGALVRERFIYPSDSITQHPRFRALTRPCSAIDAVQLIDGERTRTLVGGNAGVWVTYGDSLSGGIADSLTVSSPGGFELRYRVQRAGATHDATRLDVPLILPGHAIPRPEGTREGSVQVRVEKFPSGSTVRFPQLAYDGGSDKWSGHFVAIPSFVRLTIGDGDTACDTRAPRGDDGGLSWRFWLLVGILVAWVPLYLAWAQRVTSADA